MTLTTPSRPEPPLVATKLGEELPVFCEKCGYSLHGLAQLRCEHCTLLQFHCPECGHHQPINTLRPAAQTILGRIRGAWLVLVVIFKLNLFGWMFFAWLGMGAGWSYQYDYDASKQAQQAAAAPGTPQPYVPVWKAADFNLESALAFGLFAWPAGMIMRMALLRWRRGWVIGLLMATIVMAFIVLGVTIETRNLNTTGQLPNPYNGAFLKLLALTFVAIYIGAATVWPIWTLLAKAFLPNRTANVLLNWQCSLSNQVSALSRPDSPLKS